MSDFKPCPVCQEQSGQCLSCASYVVDGERIYYEKLKDFGATKDHEIRFINRIQKHRVTAFFHNGKLYIPSRQGRSVPLVIGLQWDAWQEQQAIIDDLKAQLNNMQACYIEVAKEKDELQKTNISLEAGLRKNSKNKQKLLGKNIELQKRIDEALEDLEYPTAPWDETIASVVKVLRGASD